MSNNQVKIRVNLLFLFHKYPELRNKNYNYLVMAYWKEFDNIIAMPQLEYLTSIESIGRQKRKLAEIDPIFRPDNYKVIEHRKNKTKEILESVMDYDEDE